MDVSKKVRYILNALKFEIPKQLLHLEKLPRPGLNL